MANTRDGLDQPELDAGTQPGLCSRADSSPVEVLKTFDASDTWFFCRGLSALSRAN